jgi:hypothetical protein
MWENHNFLKGFLKFFEFVLIYNIKYYNIYYIIS